MEAEKKARKMLGAYEGPEGKEGKRPTEDR